MTQPTNLNEYYQSKGKQLPSIEQRIADPAFQQALTQAGMTSQQYLALGGNNAEANIKLLPFLSGGQGGTPPKSPNPTPTPVPTNPATPVPPAGTPATPIFKPTGDKNLDASLQQQNAGLVATDKAYNDMKTAVATATIGPLQLTQEDQQYLQAMNASTLRAEQLSKRAYDSQTAVIREAMARSGATQTAPEVAASQVALSIQSGVDALQSIDAQANLAIAQFEQGIRSGQIQAARDSYKDFETYQKDRSDTLEKMYKDVADHEKEMRQYSLDQQKFKLDLAKGGFMVNSHGAIVPDPNSQIAGGAQDLAQQLVNGMVAPSQLSKRSTGPDSYQNVLKAADAYSMATTGKHFDIAKADRDYKFANNVQTQNTLNYLGSLVGTIDPTSGKATGGNLGQLVEQSNTISRTKFPAINDVRAWAKLASGDPNIASYYATVTEVSDQVAKILQGGGTGGGTSDAKLAQASALFNKGFNKEQIAAIADNLTDLLANRATSMIGDNPYLSDYADQFGTSGNNTLSDPLVVGGTSSGSVGPNNSLGLSI